jgi:hypothetical protein
MNAGSHVLDLFGQDLFTEFITFKGKKLAEKHKVKIRLDKFMGQSLYFIRLSFIRDILREV